MGCLIINKKILYKKKENKKKALKGYCIVVICTCLSWAFVDNCKQEIIRHYVKKITEHLRLYILLEGRPRHGTRGDPPHHQSRLDLWPPLYDSAPHLLYSALLLYDFSVQPQSKAAPPITSGQPHHVTQQQSESTGRSRQQRGWGWCWWNGQMFDRQ